MNEGLMSNTKECSCTMNTRVQAKCEFLLHIANTKIVRANLHLYIRPCVLICMYVLSHAC